MPNDNYKRLKLSPALHTRLKRLQTQLKESTGRFVSQGETVERALGALERERVKEEGEDGFAIKRGFDALEADDD